MSTLPRVALITGAARRIGRAIALDLAGDGWSVAVHHHASNPEADSLVTEIARTGGKAIALAADLADPAVPDRLLDQARAALGPIGLLVNNAAVFERDEAPDVTRAGWTRHMEVNLWAPFALTQGFARQLPSGAEGVVINLLDQRVWNLTPHFVSYTVSKAALWTLTQTLALALAPRIRVMGIGPGPVLKSARQSPEAFAAQAAATPLARPASADEICGAIRFVLATPSLTGQMIALDGGQHLGWAQVRRGGEEE
ncbi:MAG: SDR family oxidoreductase [Alphaproteobacteria bacterium]|nr:SDR family oxidoreductase [Alphaproteobacteria bacterium]